MEKFNLFILRRIKLCQFNIYLISNFNTENTVDAFITNFSRENKYKEM